MYTHYKTKAALFLSIGLLLSGTACTSTGEQRVSSIGPAGPQGAQGPQGTQGEQGPQGETGAAGPQGAQGEQGEDGSFTLGDAGVLAAAGLIGPDGLAGTGLLANTGDPNGTPYLLSGVLVESGEVVNVVADGGLLFAQIADDQTGTPIAGTVVGVLETTGQTLIQSGNGETYLVDGLLAAPGDVITTSIGDSYALGGDSSNALLGASLLSGNQNDGDLLTFGLNSNGELVTLEDNSGLLGEESPLTASTLTEPANDIIEAAVTQLDEGDGLIETIVTPVIETSGDSGLLDTDVGGLLDEVTGDEGDGLLGGLLGGN